MKDAWLDTCSATIQNFVERATRLEPDNLDLELVEKIDFGCQINLSLNFRIETEKNHQAGRVHAGNGTLVFNHAFQYSEALQAETSAVLSRKETLREAREHVLSQPYGGMKKETVIYSHPKRLCLTENCTQCNGRGQVSCSWCYGSGRVTCTSCGGSAQVLDQRSYYDHYTKQNRVESYYRTCSTCSGGSVRCSHCSGSGNQRCSPCDGTGETTLITRLHTVAVPNYHMVYYREDVQTFIKDGLYKAGIPELERYGTIALTESTSDEALRCVNFTYNAEIPFARFTSRLPLTPPAEQPIHWVIYGITPHILDSGHVIERMLKKDLDGLVYQSSTGKLLNPLVAAFSRKTVATFMESEAHQEMLDANRAGKSGEMLREAMNRSVTTTYIDEALTSLKAITRAIQNWSVLKWSFFSAFLIYLFMPFYTAYGRFWVGDPATGHLYLTPFTRWDSQQRLLTSLELLARYCGLFMAIAAIVMAVVGYLWRRGWVHWRMDSHLADWAVDKKILRSGWFVSLLLTSLFTTCLLMLCPIWVTHEGVLFGQYPIKELLQWILQSVK
ncbi:zinc finger-like domain-containing protein [Yokenella regensburgei]|uniref:zinc finger-like domain-containing protein n=1 Tax=Yokenella regensburgei TaxID=158877 RepID=UPI003F141AE4